MRYAIAVPNRAVLNLVAGIGLLFLSSRVQSEPRAVSRPAAKLPQFSSFKVSTTYRGKPAAVNLKSHPDARRYAAALRADVAQGPNFAGHFRVVTWVCGSYCEKFAIVDAATGKVFMPAVSLQVGSDYRLDSTLFIVNPPQDWRRYYGTNRAQYPKNARSKYLRWTGRKFIMVATVEPWRYIAEQP